MKHYGWLEVIVHDQGPEFMGYEFQNPAGAAGVLTMPIDSQSLWQHGKTERAGQSFKHQLWDLDEECRIEGRSLKLQWPSVVTRGTDTAIGQIFLRINVCLFLVCVYLEALLSDDPIDRQLLTADPYTNFHRANEMRTAAQRALFKQNSARAVQAAGLARHRSQPRRKTSMREIRLWCGATTICVEEKRMDWTRCRGSSITNENILSGSPCVDAY